MRRATDIAWAAGLFEGEGNLYLSKGTSERPPQPQMGLSMTDRDVVERFSEVIGAGAIKTRDDKNHPHFKRQYRWRLCGWGAITDALKLLRPYLGERRLERVKEFEAARDAPRRGRPPKSHCKHGHAMTEENTLIVKQAANNGVHRKCRTCIRERKRAAYRKKALNA